LVIATQLKKRKTTITQPLNQNKMKQKEYKPTRQDKSRAEMNAIGAILILIVITIGIIAFTLQTIFNIL